MKISKALFVTACLTACLSLAAGAMAQKSAAAPASTKPAGTSAAKPMHHASTTSTVTATVVSVDPATRKVTLKDESGAEYSITAEPSVKNLAQVKPGDIVTATYTESVGYVVKKDGATGMTASQGMTSAAPGEKPAAVSTSKTTVTVKITAIDPKVPSVTFKGPQGSTHTVKVEDPEKLEGVMVGDMVDITYTEALSLKVHTPAAAKKK
jgi:ribosomal protein S1